MNIDSVLLFMEEILNILTQQSNLTLFKDPCGELHDS